MNERTIHALELPKILQAMSAYALSGPGRAKALSARPAPGFLEAARRLNETTEAASVLCRAGNPLNNYDDPEPLLLRAKKGAVLSLAELLRAARFLRLSRTARQKLSQAEYAPLLSDMASLLLASPALEEELFNSILSEEEMADTASPLLQTLRKKIRQAGERIRERMNQLLREFSPYLQESVITLRNDRYVLPVKADSKGRVKGIVHDQSSTGATCFIEPMAVVEINNELRILRSQESEEVERILAEFSGRLAPLAEGLLQNASLLCELDFIFARANYSLEQKNECPELNDRGFLRLEEARHPLLERQSAVPVSVELGGRFSVLLITGPNTGGKTVTLKTVGLFALMAQCGLYLPARRAEVPVFSDIFADIGDEQSIEQSLSTFSSHVTHIIDILRLADKNALVLLDELGAGTDPGEGGALAVAILEELRARGCRVVATTHYTELKAYSMETENVENASVEFDVRTLRPTYRLLVGVPGASNALLIARRLGMPAYLVDKARARLSDSHAVLEEALQKADALYKDALKKEELARSRQAEADRELAKAKAEAGKWQQKEEELLQKAQKKAEDVLEAARRQAEEVIARCNELSRQAATKEIIEMQTLKNSLEVKKTAPEPRQAAAAALLQKGDEVEVLSLSQAGVIISVNQDKGEALVRAGSLQLTVPVTGLALLEKAKGKKTASSKIAVPARPLVSASLDIRGQTVEEGILELERYLDSARNSGLSEVTVIHGKGTGALKAGIVRYLRQAGLPFRPGRYGEGDAGVTVVEL